MSLDKAVRKLIDEGAKHVEVSFKGKTRKECHQIFHKLFGDEEPGTGRVGNKISRYVFEDMDIEDAEVKSFLITPTRSWNPGKRPHDVKIQMEDRLGVWPSEELAFEPVFNYLKTIRTENPTLYKEKAEKYLDKVYNCQDVDYKEVSQIRFKTVKRPFVAMLVVIKQFFHAEDIVNWQYSGRKMSYSLFKLLDMTFAEAWDTIFSKTPKATLKVTSAGIWHRVAPKAEIPQRLVQYILEVHNLLSTNDKALKAQIVSDKVRKGTKNQIVNRQKRLQRVGKWSAKVVETYHSMMEKRNGT